MESIRIKCPCCGAVLNVKNLPGIETKKVRCPLCKESSPFLSFQALSKPRKIEDSTKLSSNFTISIGQLKIKDSQDAPYQLGLGKNVVGREAAGSSTHIQIPAKGAKSMSREHLIIEVKEIPGKGIVHYVSLYKEQVNPTKINGQQLEYGDSVILKHGDTIQFPDTALIFENIKE